MEQMAVISGLLAVHVITGRPDATGRDR